MDISAALSDIDSLSHAYALEGGDASRDALLARLASIGFAHTGHPDAFVRTYESFGIDESREITARSSRKPVASSRTIIVLTTPSMTHEAQNALLKTFEDPLSSVTFFLITPSFDVLLPTLRSRLLLLATATREADPIPLPAFMAASGAARIEMLKPLIEHKRLGEILALLSGVERTLALRGVQNTSVQSGLRAVYRARRYAADKGALLKVLLEQVALLVPRQGTVQ